MTRSVAAAKSDKQIVEDMITENQIKFKLKIKTSRITKEFLLN